MKKLFVIFAFTFLGIIPILNTGFSFIETANATTVSRSDEKVVTAYKKIGNGNVVTSKKVTLRRHGDTWKLYESNTSYDVYERNTTIKGVTYTHVAGPWAFFM